VKQSVESYRKLILSPTYRRRILSTIKSFSPIIGVALQPTVTANDATVKRRESAQATLLGTEESVRVEVTRI
jgi:hypothetical protein